MEAQVKVRVCRLGLLRPRWPPVMTALLKAVCASVALYV